MTATAMAATTAGPGQISLYQDDLAKLLANLDQPLQTALELLQPYDDDLARALARVKPTGRRLVTAASDVLLATLAMQGAMAGWQRRASSSDAAHLRAAERLLSRLQKRIDRVLCDYAELTDNVGYMADCVEISCDAIAICATEADEKTAGQIRAQKAALQGALVSLRCAAELLSKLPACFQVILLAGCRISAALRAVHKTQKMQKACKGVGESGDELAISIAGLTRCLDQIIGC